jgi:hypothetical protein
LPQGKLTELKILRLYRGTTAREIWSLPQGFLPQGKEARLNFPCGRASIQPQGFLPQGKETRLNFPCGRASIQPQVFLISLVVGKA